MHLFHKCASHLLATPKNGLLGRGGHTSGTEWHLIRKTVTKRRATVFCHMSAFDVESCKDSPHFPTVFQAAEHQKKNVGIGIGIGIGVLYDYVVSAIGIVFRPKRQNTWQTSS